MDAKHIGQAAQRPAAAQVAIGVVDLLQPIQVEQQNGERSSRTPRSFDLRVEDVEQSEVIAQACKGVGNRQKPCLRFRLFALRQVESRNKAARFAIKINRCCGDVDRKSTRLNSSHGYISYAVFCLKKKNVTSTMHASACQY